MKVAALALLCVLGALVLAGCAAAPPVPPVRFANAAVAEIVNDRLPVAKPPANRVFLPGLYDYEGTIEHRVTRALEIPRSRRALGVNALDNVPDSTWFTNRIGVRALTLDEMRKGPVTDDPSLHTPWTVRSTKIGGAEVGLIIADSTGVKYVIKFDGASDPPELESGTDAVVGRLLWACGYNVAQDQVVYLRESDLVLAPDAAVKDLNGHTVRKLRAAELARTLRGVIHESDGRLRILVSRWIDGKTIGGHPGEGVREDDRNDRIPHELRRDLRGQAAIYAWLDAVDVTEGQYVDTWLADRDDPKRHYVVHYAIDFGKGLGAMGAIGDDWWRGYTYRLDFRQLVRQLFTLGFASRPWEHRSALQVRGVSPLFNASSFDPDGWRPDYPTYLAFRTADRFDKFWGAKVIARFTREQIHAAVEAGRFSDPRAVDYITDILVARQRITEAYWFARVNPLDTFAVDTTPDGTALCFDDLAITNAITPATGTDYTIATYDRAAHPIAARVRLAAAANGHVCVPRLPLAADGDGYTIVAITTTRASFSGTTFVHVARDPASNAPRVIGVWRQ